MSRTIYCDDHAKSAAVMLVTNLESGEVAALCGGCVGPWCLTMAQALLPGEFDGAAEVHLVDEAAPGEGGAAPDPPRPKSRRKPAEKAAQALTAPGSPFPDVTPDDG